MFDVKKCLADCEKKMDASVMHLEETLAQIRAGRANVHILDAIRINSYGSMVPLNNVAAITTPDARTIAIKPWDKSMFAPIEKAIIDSEVGIMAKQCNKEGEEAKMAIRNARREGNDKLKKALKDGLSEDSEKDAEADLQKIHDRKVKQVDTLLAEKNKEIMTV